MALISARPLLADAQQNGYAVGAFNIDNLEALDAILDAAEAERAPVILALGQGILRSSRLPSLAAMVKGAAAAARVPAALHLDHGHSFAQAMQCLRQGFTSIMIDGSTQPLAENIALTRSVVQAAHAMDVPVEGELGQIGGVEDEMRVDEDKAGLTDPAHVEPFVSGTRIDSLAVSIGNAHGLYKREPRLRFDVLARCRDLTAVPLVLHGGSGIPDDAIRQAVSLGICKINVATELRLAYLGAARPVLAEGGDLARLMGEARKAMVATVRAKIKLFGASGRA